MFWTDSHEVFLIQLEAKIIWRCLEALDMREQKSRRGMWAGSSWKPFGGSELIGSSESFRDIEPFGGSVLALWWQEAKTFWRCLEAPDRREQKLRQRREQVAVGNPLVAVRSLVAVNL